MYANPTGTIVGRRLRPAALFPTLCRLTYFACHLPLSPVKATPTIETVQFTSKGQVVIPARVRRQFQIEEGTKASVTTTPEGILIRPITRAYIKSLRGSLKGKGVMKAMMTDRKREREL